MTQEEILKRQPEVDVYGKYNSKLTIEKSWPSFDNAGEILRKEEILKSQLATTQTI